MNGIYYDDSPTQSISYEVVSSLEKVIHNHDMLSLEKTKSLNEVEDFLGTVPYLAMCKMDGLTCSLKYVDGILVSAETRGNGQVGENILHNAKVIPSIPNKIPYKEEIIIDGEIICSKHDFVKFENEYKNPRNFASGSIRLLDSNECSKRKLQFIAWDVINGFNHLENLSEKLILLKGMGFIIAPFCDSKEIDADGNSIPIDSFVDQLVHVANFSGYPIDGIVFKFNNVDYGRSLGQTSHHFKNAIAYKFYDELYETELIDIEWSIGRTGILTPVAIFKTVEIDGADVSRASLHNLSILREVLYIPYVGQKVYISKRNMIIPQIEKAEQNFDDTKTMIAVAPVCPSCGAKTAIKSDNSSDFLMCSNADCDGKLINKLDHFCGKKGLDIKGLSKATLEKLIEWDWVSNYTDIFELSQYKDEWMQKPGFGQKSVENILSSIDMSKICNLNQYICALGIPLIGSTASKDLEKHFKTWDAFLNAVKTKYSFSDLPNFGYEMSSSIINYNYSEAELLAEHYIQFNVSTENGSNELNDKVFVITGKLNNFKNRDELKDLIESRGGKVSGSVSGKTNYLINNDLTSNSSKNVSAKKLGIPIISEDMLIEMLSIF